MIPMDNHCLPSTSTSGLVFPTNYGVNGINTTSGFHPAVDSSGSVAAGVKQEAALVMDWSVEEQYVLENGLAKYVSSFLLRIRIFPFVIFLICQCVFVHS